MWKRAFWATLSFFGWNIRTVTTTIFLWFIGFLIYWQWQGKDAVKEEMFVAVAFGLAPIALFLIGLYLFHLIRAPVYIKWEKEKAPRLIVEKVIAEKMGISGDTVWELLIHNDGTSQAYNCKGRLIGVNPISSDKSVDLQKIPHYRTLEWADPMIGGPIFHIPGRESALLKVVSLSAQDDQLRFQYEDVDASVPLPSPCDLILVISVTSENTLPRYVVCKLIAGTKKEHTLELVKVTDEFPKDAILG